jgi:endonuclease/exonuclease/phosphatase family metal-dependent hydrolase
VTDGMNGRIGRRTLTGVALTLALQAGACVSVQNQVDPDGPRHAGLPSNVTAPASRHAPDVQVASFNVEHGLEIDRALEVIQNEPGLRDAEILLLQEMDSEGTARIAHALGMEWVYYPATVRDGREFGNAVLSRWPIIDDEKLILPHLALYGRTLRTATVATVDVAGTPIRVYSVHIATPVNQLLAARRQQMETVIEDASDHPYVIIGGDLNSNSLPEIALEAGYFWPTQEGPRTAWFARVDHILFKGLVPPWSGHSGTTMDTMGASDHLPVWARGRIR